MIDKRVKILVQISSATVQLMKRTVILFFMMLLVSPAIKGQDRAIEPGSDYALPPESGEKIALYTDRTLYIATEKIFLTADYSVDRELRSLDWSHVLYIELIRWNGDKIVQEKFALDKYGASGYLEIPDEVLSGNYYLRAYTRWMRNYPADHYAYTCLKIVNPWKQETDPGPKVMDDVKASLPESVVSENSLRGILCSTSKTAYRQRERVDLNLISAGQMSGANDNYCITVVKAGSIDTTYDAFPVSCSDISKPGEIDFLPELRGISVSGVATEKHSGDPLAGVETRLAIPITGEYFSVFQTNKQGRFFFTLPFITGRHDLFIEALTDELAEPEIKIDNDFCNVPVILPYLRFELDKEEEKLVVDMMIDSQLKEKFTPDSFKDSKKREKPIVFYGKPQHLIHMEDYIELIDLEEFIFELVPEIIVHHKKGKSFIRFERITGLSNLSPLVLIDNLPVSDLGQFLKTPVNKLERIELINKGYVAGNQIFNGLLSVYSKNNDFAGIEMVQSSMFFNYSLYSNNTEAFQADSRDLDKTRLPDRRNLLYWNPHVSLYQDSTTNISFYTSDSRGKYVVYVRNTSNSQEPSIHGICSFTVE
jgi:hypothetical protein